MAFFVGAVVAGIIGVAVVGGSWVVIMVMNDGDYRSTESLTSSTCEEAMPDDALRDLGFDPDEGSMSGGYGNCTFDGGDVGRISINVHEGTNYGDRTDQNKVRSYADVLDECAAPYYAVQREYNPDWLELPKGVLSCASVGEDEFRGRKIGVEVQAERSAALTVDIEQSPDSVTDGWESPTAAIVQASREAL